MKNLVYLLIGLTFLTQSCEQKKEAPKELALNTETYESALDVPVNKVGVLINIDSLGFFDHNSQNLDQSIDSKSIENQLKQINSKFDIVKVIRDKSEKILNDNKYIAKTYVYINILDLKNNALKYSETIGGTKYIDKTINKNTTDYLEKMMKESLNETLDIIDNKY